MVDKPGGLHNTGLRPNLSIPAGGASLYGLHHHWTPGIAYSHDQAKCERRHRSAFAKNHQAQLHCAGTRQATPERAHRSDRWKDCAQTGKSNHTRWLQRAVGFTRDRTEAPNSSTRCKPWSPHPWGQPIWRARQTTCSSHRLARLRAVLHPSRR